MSSSTANNAAPFASFRRYTVGEPLGAGAFSTVFRGDDPQLRRAVAVKVLSKEATTNLRWIESGTRMIREAQVLAALCHPNIVQIFDVGIVGERVVLVMEFMAGGTFDDWRATDPSSAQVVDAFVAVGRALCAAHDLGILHRDIKPANVLRTADGVPKLADFGLARGPVELEGEQTELSSDDITTTTLVGDAALAVTRTGDVLGTPNYMAPESHQGEHTEASDQYSFFVSLTKVLTDQLPFTATTAAKLLWMKRNTEPSLVGVDRRVAKVLRRGLRADPSKRYRHMEEACAALRGATRSRLWVVAAATAGVALVGAVSASAGAPVRTTPECPQLPPIEQAQFPTWSQGNFDAAATAKLDGDVERLIADMTAASHEACDTHDVSRAVCVQENWLMLSEVLQRWNEDPSSLGRARMGLDQLLRRSCEGPAQQDEVDPVLVRAEAAVITSQFDVGFELATRVLADAPASARGRVARAHMVRARCARADGERQHLAVEEFRAAVWAGLGIDDIGLAEEALLGLAVQADRLADENLMAWAESRWQSLEHSNPRNEAAWQTTWCSRHALRGDLERAVRACARAEEAFSNSEASPMDLARFRSTQSLVALDRGALEEACALAEESVTIAQDALGEDHPLFALLQHNASNRLRVSSDPRVRLEALHMLENAQRVLQSTGAYAYELLAIRYSIAAHHAEYGNVDEAQRLLLELQDDVKDNTVLRVGVQFSLSGVAYAKGNVDEAFSFAESGLRDLDSERYGATGNFRVVGLFRLVWALSRLPDDERMRVEAARLHAVVVDSGEGRLAEATYLLALAQARVGEPYRTTLATASRLANSGEENVWPEVFAGIVELEARR